VAVARAELRRARDTQSVEETIEEEARYAQSPEEADPIGWDDAWVKARALKRALRQLSCVRHVVPGHAQLHAHVLAALRGLSADDDDLSAAGSESGLDSPHGAGAADGAGAQETSRSEQAEEGASAKLKPSPGIAPARAPDARYFDEDQEEQSAVLAVGAVSAFLSVIGGFSLGDTSNSRPKRWRKVKKEAPPPTPEEERRTAKVEAAAANVLKSVHDQLWSRWGQATEEQRAALNKNIRRGLKHLAEPAASGAKLVSYLCRVGNDWDHLVASSKLNKENIHEWSDQDWLRHASGHQHAKSDSTAQCTSPQGNFSVDSDSGESVWEEVDDEVAQDQQALSRLKGLKRKRVLRRLVQAYTSGVLRCRARDACVCVTRARARLCLSNSRSRSRSRAHAHTLSLHADAYEIYFCVCVLVLVLVCVCVLSNLHRHGRKDLDVCRTRVLGTLTSCRDTEV